MTETTKRLVKTLNENDMKDDKEWLIFLRKIHSAFHDAVRTNYVHQLNACYLDILMHKAFQQRNITDASQQWDFISC